MRVLLCCFVLLAIPFFSSAQTNPWPHIRKERIANSLRNAMRAANVDTWLIICCENANDLYEARKR